MNSEVLLQEQAAMRERSNPTEVVITDAINFPSTRKPDADNEPVSNDVMVYVRHHAKCNKKCKDGECPRWFYDKSLGWKNSRRSARTNWQAQAEAEAKRLMEERDPKNRKIAELTRQRDYKAIRLEKAVEKYITNCQDEGLSESTIREYRGTLTRMRAYCESRAAFLLGDITGELLKDWRGTWKASGLLEKSTKNKVQRQVKTFFKFGCEQMKWFNINDNPALGLTTIKGDQRVPAVPFYDDQFQAILEATYVYQDSGCDPETAIRLRALILLMRWSGLAIRDALTLPVWRIDAEGILQTERVKTKVGVELPLHEDAIRALRALRNDNPEYFFWNGTCKPQSLTGDYSRRFRTLWTFVKWPRPVVYGKQPVAPHSHMLRHTFAYWFLNTPDANGKLGDIRDLQLLLGHTRLATTEKHYSRFMPDQNKRLHTEVRARHAAPKKPAARVKTSQAGGRGKSAR